MATTVYIDASGAVAADTAKFVRTVASETTDAVNTAARLTKRVTADTTLANSHGGPALLFQRGYGTTDANDTGFAILGASYEGGTSDHEFNFLTSTNSFSSSDVLLTLSRKNADFNVPVGMNAYANLTAINAIPSPAAGMVVYNTATGTLYVYTGSQWNDVGVTAQSAYTLPAATTSALGGVIIPAVGTSGITNSSGTIGLATASTTQLGGVKVDGSTVTISSGVISANTSYTLPTASTTVLGGVKVDGSTITIDGSGVITSNSTSTLNGLTDVTITSVAESQFLRYDSATSQWINSRQITSTTGGTIPTFQRELASTTTVPLGVYAAAILAKKTTDQASGADEGGTGFLIRSIGTNSANDKNIMSIGALHRSSGNHDFIINQSNDNFTTQTTLQIQNPVRAAWYPTFTSNEVSGALLYVDKTNNRIGINDITPSYTLDVNGQIAAQSGFVGNLTGNADTVTNGVYTTGSYADPTWITSLAYSKITGAPSVTTSLDGLTDVTITNAQKGKLLVRGATDWVDTSLVEFDNTAYRTKFVNNSNPGGVGINSALEILKNTGDAPATGDGTGILFGAIQTNGTKKFTNRIISTYNSTEAHELYIQSSNDSFNANAVNMVLFATSGSQVYSDLTVSGGLNVDSGTLTVDKTNNRVGINNSSPNFTLDVGGSSYINGYATFGNNIEIQGGNLNTNQTTFNLVNTTATTVNFAGAATTLNIGNASGTVSIGGDLVVGGQDIKSANGTTAISLTDTTGDVKVAGALTIGGQVIKTGNGTTAITIADTTGNVTVAGDLRINGNDVIASDGESRLTFDEVSGTNRTTINGRARVTENLTVDGVLVAGTFSPTSVGATSVTTTNLTVNSGGTVSISSAASMTNLLVQDMFKMDSTAVASGTIDPTLSPVFRLTNSGAASFTLAAGTEGQMLILINTTNGDSTITVSNAGWKSGSGTIVMGIQGAVATMLYSGSKWHVIGSYRDYVGIS